MIETIIEHRAKGNPTVAACTKTKLILKGINPDKYDQGSADDPAVMDKLKALAVDLGVTL